eukprot:TRINITY_DN2029_c0_g2_i1.p1 TRINITY_DN2029_c0_g2~~TRINITY_DN2029_c0_g2_i1.p1  ORF type:complete len:447 (+),score=141.00 TRINITY_DN2029_c0_g2_i1:101-1441(+)
MLRVQSLLAIYTLSLFSSYVAGDASCADGHCEDSVQDDISLKQKTLRVHKHRQLAGEGLLESVLARAKEQGGTEGKELSSLVTQLAAIPGGLSLLALAGPKEICDNNAKMAADLKHQSITIEKAQLEEDQNMVDQQLKRLQLLSAGLTEKKKEADEAALPFGKCLDYDGGGLVNLSNCSGKLEGLSDLTEEICKNASQESEFHWALDGSFCGSHVCTFDTEDQCGGSKNISDFCPGLSELRKQLEKIEHGVSDAYEQYKCSMAKCEKAKDELEKLQRECDKGKGDLGDGVTECLALAGDFRAKACAYGELLQMYRTERLLFDNISAKAKQQEVTNENDWKSQMLMVCQLESCNPSTGMIDSSKIQGCMETVSYAEDIGILNDRSEEIADLDAKWNYEDGHRDIFEKEEGTIKMEWSAEGEPFEICRDFDEEDIIDGLQGVIDSMLS